MTPILVINWNNAADTLACLQSLRKLQDVPFRVWVLDNGSDWGDLRTLQNGFPTDDRFQLLTSPTNLGFTRGANFLLQEHVLPANYPFVALLNNDTIVDPQWLSQLLATAHQTGADMVASCMINFYEPARMDNAGHFLLNTGEILPLGHDEPVDQYRTPREIHGACAGAALYRVDMLRNIGLFDPFFHTGYEDAELGLRAILCGYRSYYAPTARVYHKISRSINKIRDFQYTLKIQMDVFYTTLKLWPAANLWLNLPFFLIKFVFITGMNLFFFRWKYMRVLYTAIWRILFRERQQIRSARQLFQPHRQLSAWAFQQKLVFFLAFDVQRFYKYIWKREKMVFEKYN